MGLDESSYARQMGAIKALMESLPADWRPDPGPERPLRTGRFGASRTTCHADTGDGRTQRSA